MSNYNVENIDTILLLQGGDNVVQCITNDHGEMSVSQSYNEGKVNMKIGEVSETITVCTFQPLSSSEHL